MRRASASYGQIIVESTHERIVTLPYCTLFVAEGVILRDVLKFLMMYVHTSTYMQAVEIIVSYKTCAS
jgi:hypothetical protein